MITQDQLDATIERARQATQRRDWPEACRCWEVVLENSPDFAPAYLGAGTASREAGRHDEAERTLEAGAQRFPENEQIAIARAWLANARRDWPAALDRWKVMRERFSKNPWSYLGTIQALRAAGRSDQIDDLLVQAESVLIAARQRGMDAGAAFAVEVEIAKLRLNWTAVRKAAENAIASIATPPAQVFLALAQAHWNLSEADEADRAAVRALSIDPKLSDALVVRAWVATDRGDGEAALSCYRTLAELNPGAVRWSLKVVQLLNWLGHVKEAVAELDTIRNRWPADPMVRTFLRNYGPAAEVNAGIGSTSGAPAEGDPDRRDEEEIQMLTRKAPDEALRLRPILVAAAERDVLLAEVNGADTAVLVFTGSNDSVAMPLQVFDLYLATLPMTAVYLKDFNRLRFLRGIQSLSSDLSGTIAALKEMLARLKIKHLYTLGNCDGGFAAIRYGVELDAERVVAMSPPTYSPQDALTKIEQARNFMRNRLAASIGADMIDLKSFLESRKHQTQIEIFYEEEDPRDRIQALHLAGLRDINFHPKPGLSNHHLLRQLALTTEDFRALLGNLLGVDIPATTN